MQKTNSLLKFQIISTIFIIILGTILHFTYEWSGENKIIGAFSAVNESVWEHLKLVFFPMLITTIIGYFIFGNKIICAKTAGIIAAIAFIVIFFYTYTGIIGTSYIILDIGSFIVSVFLGEYVTYIIMQSDKPCNLVLSIIILAVLLISFVVFTYKAPEINLFRDPTK